MDLLQEMAVNLCQEIMGAALRQETAVMMDLRLETVVVMAVFRQGTAEMVAHHQETAGTT